MRIVQADIELFLTGYLRTETAALVTRFPFLDGFEFDNREPEVDSINFPAKLVIVRNDGGDNDIFTGSVQIGVGVMMGGKENVADAFQAAAIIHALVQDCARVEIGNPVSAVTDSNGPYAIQEDQPRARFYSTHTLSTVGTSL